MHREKTTIKILLTCSLLALSILALHSAYDTAELPEYYCHDVKQDRSIFAEAEQKIGCKDTAGRFENFSRKERQYFCRLSDSGFSLGKFYSHKKAEEKCAETSGTL